MEKKKLLDLYSLLSIYILIWDDRQPEATWKLGHSNTINRPRSASNQLDWSRFSMKRQQLNLTGESRESREIVQIDRSTWISMVNLRRFVVCVVVLLIKLISDDLFLPQVCFTDGIVRDQTYDEITPPITPPSTPVQSDKFTRSLNEVTKLYRQILKDRFI